MRWLHWVTALWPLLIALALGWLVRRGLLALARKARARPLTDRRARIAQVIALPAAVALPLFFLSVAVAGLPLPAPWVGRVQHWLAVGGLLCLTWLAVRAIGAIERGILRRYPVEVADNLRARRIQTQTRVLGRTAQITAGLIGVSIALMTFPPIRQLGTTLLASAGIVGLVAGIAARPVFGNMIAGLQIALTQPIRLDDVVIIDGEWGRVEEITSAYVVVRVWDERRLVVPLQWFVENPFQNWTRTTAELLGTVFIWSDYCTPMAGVREELLRICQSDERWDGRVCVAQVTETGPNAMQIRLLVSARNSGDLFDLRCAVRERMIDFLNTRYPEALPRLRAALTGAGREAGPGNGLSPRTSTHSPMETADTSSPGAEHITEADLAAQRTRQSGGGRGSRVDT